MDYYLATPHFYLVARIYVVSYLTFDGIPTVFLSCLWALSIEILLTREIDALVNEKNSEIISLEVCWKLL